MLYTIDPSNGALNDVGINNDAGIAGLCFVFTPEPGSWVAFIFAGAALLSRPCGAARKNVSGRPNIAAA